MASGGGVILAGASRSRDRRLLPAEEGFGR